MTKCHYTGLEIEDGAPFIELPGVVPQASVKYRCHPTAREAYRAAKHEFHKVDRNCNACAHVRRVPHDRLLHGMTVVDCNIGLFDGPRAIHPDDCMDMPCWVSRPRVVKAS